MRPMLIYLPVLINHLFIFIIKIINAVTASVSEYFVTGGSFLVNIKKIVAYKNMIIGGL